MSPIAVDFTDVESKDFAAIPVGNYVIEVASVEERETKKGDPMLNWGLRVIEGDYEGRMLFTNTVLTKNSLWKMKQFLTALGFSEGDLTGEIDLDPDTDLVGLTAIARVTQRVYEGELRNDVKGLKPLPAEQIEEAAPETDSPFVSDTQGEMVLP
jgi:Protein of unknown function (DUF669)